MRADIRSSQEEAEYVEERVKQQNHEQNQVAKLLKVPRYADLLEDDNDIDMNGDGEELSESQSVLVRSHEGWRKEMAKWKQEEQTRSDDSDEEELRNVTYGQK